MWWRSVNETLSNFCSSAFWDNNLTWNSPDPDFTVCFENTILAWFPCAFLWLFSLLEIHYLRHTNAFNIRFNWYNASKLVAIALLGVTTVIDVGNYIFVNDIRHPVDIHTPVIKYLSFCLFFGLTYANIKCGMRSSGILFLFSFLLVFCGAPQFRTILRSRQGTGADQEIRNYVTYLMYYPLVLVIFLLNCFADASPTIQTYPTEKKPCPENTTSFLSNIIYAWFDKFAWKAYQKPLTNDDIWDLDYEMRTATIVRRFEAKWQSTLDRLRKSANVDVGVRFENQKLLGNDEDRSKVSVERKSNENAKRASIMRPLLEVFGSYFMFGVIFKLFHSSLNFANPQILELILGFVKDQNEYFWRGCLYVFVLLAVALLQTIVLNFHFCIMNRTGLQIRTALVSIIYKKALKISSGAKRDFTVGEIVNLMAVDAQRFVQLTTFIPLLWICPVEICVSVYCLWNILGPSVLAGVGVLILLMIVNGVVISKIQKLQMRQMKYKDERVKIISEILSGIKVLKLYACEPSFEKLVARTREKEIKILKNTAYLQAGSSFTWICTPFMVSFVTFGTFVLSSEKNILNAQVAFVSLSLFNIMKFSMELLPLLVTGLVQASVAVRRMNKFLNSEELDPNAVSHEQRPEPVVVENGDFSWESYNGTPALRNINMNVKSGSLVAIVGPVGAGKSSLLSAILGEMYKQSGYVNTTGKLAYVPQQAWIQNVSLKDNITFGDTSKSAFYDRVLEACALISDLEILAGGDQTEIGEKGINLSGGQKQRISLARAVYSEADVYLLDDPLSAVDAHVGQHIFEKVIGPNGLLHEKTRVFATHNITYLPQVDHIIVLQNGIIAESGTYNELLKKGGDFANFLATYMKDSDEKEDVKNDIDLQEKVEMKNELETPVENGREVVSKRNKKVSESEEKTKVTDAVQHTLTESEEAQTGNVKWDVYKYYLTAVGSLMLIVTIMTNLSYQAFAIASDYWLSAWSNDETTTEAKDGHNDQDKQYMYLGVYALFGTGQAFSIMLQTVALYLGMLKAAKYIHNRLLACVLHWPAITFDRIPSGRIINRFGFDVDVLDNTLPTHVFEFLTYTALVSSSLFVISYNTPMFLSVLLPLGVVYYFIQRIYATMSKQLKRLESVSKSPIYSHFGDTISGSQSIRAYGLEAQFIDKSDRKVDFNQKSSYAGTVVNRWFMVRLDLVGAVIIFSAALFAILGRNSISAALVGLSVTYALQVTGNLGWWIRMVSEVETDVVALERIKEYIDVEHEAPWVSPKEDEAVSKNWPTKGEISFVDFQVRYQKDTKPVLKGISFKVNGGEKVGIVGRTGAGKSSLTLSLFRIIESSGGSIIIDGIDVSKIGLHTLRGRLTIIPQDPVLFSGTLRMNLDPAEQFTDANIWRVLELSHLKTYVTSLNSGLQYVIDEGGSNFSVGQRQLICLARALLRKTKVLVLDEATAAVDFETDDLIQATIRKEFKDSTVLTIAHRLNTVLDYDRIMVMDKGRVAEFDSPNVLLESKQSIFYSMAVDAGLL